MPGPLSVFFHLFHLMAIIALWNKYYSFHLTKEYIDSGQGAQLCPEPRFKQIGLFFLKSIIIPLRYLGIPHYKPLHNSKFYIFPLGHPPPPIHNTLYSLTTMNFFLLYPPGFLVSGFHISCVFHVEFSSSSSLPVLLTLQVVA